MTDTIYPFDKEKIEEMARLHKQASVLDALIPLPDLVQIERMRACRVLDLACGPGSWALTVAQRFPKWQVYGLDISERMTDFARVQAQADKIENVSFQVGNALEGLPDGPFDFIHARLLQCFMSIDAWSVLLAECRRVLRPGGMIQMVESERPICNKPANTQFSALAAQSCVRLGVSGSPDGQAFGVCNQLAHFLLQAGFSLDEQNAYTVDYSYWSPLHETWCENVVATMKQYPEVLAKQGQSREEAEQLCEQAIQEMSEPDFCALFFFLSVVARKP